MFTLKKNLGSISMPWLGLVPEIMPGPNFFSLEAFYRYPGARQLMFFSIGEVQAFIRSNPGLCGTESVICRAKFIPNGVTFEPVPAQEIPPAPARARVATADDSDDNIPF
jgi:hypothetical protein